MPRSLKKITGDEILQILQVLIDYGFCQKWSNKYTKMFQCLSSKVQFNNVKHQCGSVLTHQMDFSASLHAQCPESVMDDGGLTSAQRLSGLGETVFNDCLGEWVQKLLSVCVCLCETKKYV